MRRDLFFGITVLVTVISSITAINSFDTKSNILNAYATLAGFNVELSGNEEVPPVQTDATGSAEFTAPHFDNIGYSVNVSNIDKVTAAHIHSGKIGENGPIVVTLFKTETPSTEPINGNLASGNITNANLEGPMAGKTVIDLTKSMELGETYVNVHTEENPNGEIRGQIKGGG
ncbi:MAG TPA: CHRD domain-containing protein [Candidatus Nitrosocosmicus sp.]|nr:CHRD domain-containing protein [Candidatus Nitrosocosmicus sp.]